MKRILLTIAAMMLFLSAWCQTDKVTRQQADKPDSIISSLNVNSLTEDSLLIKQYNRGDKTKHVFSQDYDYLVEYNGKIIETRHYQNDTLSSIIAYNCTDTKDSITYNGQDIKWYHYRDHDFHLDSLSPFQKFYYAYFDKSFQTSQIYSLIKKQSLIEDVLWSLAVIDDEISSDSTLSSNKKTIYQDESSCCIVYKIDSRCMLHQLFETYKDEVLKELSVDIKNGVLSKLVFEGDNINKIVTFKYNNDSLIEETVRYLDSRTGKSCAHEEYRFYRNSR